MNRVRAHAARFVLDQRGRFAAHVRKKGVRLLNVGHNIPRMAISAFVTLSRLLARRRIEVASDRSWNRVVGENSQEENWLIRANPIANRCLGQSVGRQLARTANGGLGELLVDSEPLGLRGPKMK